MQSGQDIVQEKQLRNQENLRLLRELDELQRRITQYEEQQAQQAQQVKDIQQGHRLEVERYESYLRDLMDELNQKQKALQESDERYKKFTLAFDEAVTEEAERLVEEASQALVHAPEHLPPILQNISKTLELQSKQTEDLHFTEAMLLARQVQHKKELLEQELAREYESIEQARQQISIQQESLREQAQLRQQYIESSLRARFTAVVTLVTGGMLVLFALLELVVYEYFYVPLQVALFLPIIFLVFLAFILGRVTSRPGKPVQATKPAPQQKQK